MFTRAVPAEAARAAEDEIKLLLERARAGDVQALPALRETLDMNPELALAWGDLAAHARAAWLSLIAGHDLALKESLGRKAAAMLYELAGPGAPPLERLLAERVVATWLEVNHADAAAAQAEGVTLRQASFSLKRQESAHRRHLAAIGALATVRRLVPAAAEVVVPAPMAPLPVPVDAPGETDGAVTAGGPGAAVPDAAPDGGTAEAARVIPFKPGRGASRVRGA